MTADDSNASSARWLIIGLAVALFVFQFADTTYLKLQVWDESRLAVNAIEMLLSGNHAVTTYGFVPDLWNTKPPLVINLMALSMQLFGPTPFAARLPSALAACATVILTAWFARRETGSLSVGIAAGILLACSSLFYGHHGGQTSDYDAPLTLLTTAYAVALYELIHASRPRIALALTAGLLVGLAVLAKSIAGLVPGIGIAVYALMFGSRPLVRHLPDYALVATVALLVGGSYYVFRIPGGTDYLAAVAANDLGGRFGAALDNHIGGPFFYVEALLTRSTAILFPLLGGLLLLRPGRARRLALFAVCQFAGMLLVYSFAATKLRWYIMPALPFVTIALALGGKALIDAATRRFGPDRPKLAALAILACVIGQAIVFRYVKPIDPAAAPAYDVLIATAQRERPGATLTVVESGVDNDAGFIAYAPTLRFYALAAATRGVRTVHASSLAVASTAKLVGGCGRRNRDIVARIGSPLWSGDLCALVERTRTTR